MKKIFPGYHPVGGGCGWTKGKGQNPKFVRSLNCNHSLLPLLWQSKINPDNLYARQAPNRGCQLENWSKVTLQYLTSREPAWRLLWKAKEHMWWYNPARERGAHLRPRVTEAKMFTAKIFYCCYFNRTEDTKLHTWVDLHRLLLQTTGKANNNYKGIIMLSEVSCCSVSSGHTVFGGFLRLPVYFRFIPGQGAHTVAVCPPHCSQKMAICGWQYNASAVPSGPTTQNGNHNPNTCLLGGKKGPS